MGVLKCVCISKERKASAYNVHNCGATKKGLEGDIHYGVSNKQISLLPCDKVREYFEEKGEDILYGRFGENLVVEGIGWKDICIGKRFISGNVILEVVKIGAGGPASDAYKGEKVCSPMEPYFVFCKVIRSGILAENDEIYEMDERM
ncbi:MAG: MOSC domain-containing protein [Eubacteriales bacterium]|nr:MOSC domain-containing protein [Eubacteriales bacterium]